MTTASPSFVKTRVSQLGHPNTVSHVFRSLAARAGIRDVKFDYVMNIGPGLTEADSNAWAEGYAPSGLADFFTAPVSVPLHSPDYTTLIRYYFKERTDYDSVTHHYTPKPQPFRQIYAKFKLTIAPAIRIWFISNAEEVVTTSHGGDSFFCVEIKADGTCKFYNPGPSLSSWGVAPNSMFDPTPYLVYSNQNADSTPHQHAYNCRVEVQISIVRQSDWQVAQVAQVWFNGTLIASQIIGVRPFPLTPESKFGLYNINSINIECGSGMLIEEFQIPQLNDMVEWHSIDPGESPDQALSRAIEGRYLIRFARFDGSLAAMRSQDRPVSEAYTTRNDTNMRPVYGYKSSVDKRELFSHIRMVGAWEQAEYVSALAARVVGAEFTELKNPYLEDEADCFFEAQKTSIRMMERAFTAVGSSPIHPLLEREDVVSVRYYNGASTYGLNYYFISEMGIQFSGDGKQRLQSFSFRGNFYDHT